MQIAIRCLLVAALSAQFVASEVCSKEKEELTRKYTEQIGFMQTEIMRLTTLAKDLSWSVMRIELGLHSMRKQESVVAGESMRTTGTGAVKTPTTTYSNNIRFDHRQRYVDLPDSNPLDTPSLMAIVSFHNFSNCTGNLEDALRYNLKDNSIVEIKISKTKNPPTAMTSDVHVNVTVPEMRRKGEIFSCKNTDKSGIRLLRLASGTTAKVLCDATYDKGGWTVIQYRFNGTEDFYRDWKDYKEGFGSLDGEFWLGNEVIHQLTAAKPVEIHFVLEDFDGKSAIAKYDAFQVGSESEKYILKSLGTYSGTAGDSVSRNVGSKFSTKDADNDKSGSQCAVMYVGGWWYDDCHLANLNGLYMKGNTSVYAKSMCWNTFKGFYYSLKISRIMIREV